MTKTTEEIKELKFVSNSNQHDEVIISSIVDGNVKKEELKNEAAVELEKMKLEATLETSKLEAEAQLEVKKLEAEHHFEIKKMETEATLELERYKAETALELEKMKMEAYKDLQEISKDIEEIKAVREAKTKLTEKLLDVTTTALAIGGFVTYLCMKTSANKDIQLEKIRQGQFD